MYNRYVRNNDGVYARHTQPEASGPTPQPPPRSDPVPPPQPPPPPPPAHSSEHKPKPTPKSGGELQFLSRMLDRLHLGDIDAGDLLLLMMMFYLFREGGDEELLIAIGLLLIL